jgi:soluble lytic murein transglycosylase
MGKQAKLTAKTIGLFLLVLMPFIAHHYLAGIVEYRAPQSDEIAELIDAGQYARAYRLLQRLPSEDLSVEEITRSQFQLALCERQLSEPARAYARLRELSNTLPVLEEYRHFWMARSLEDMRETDAAVSAYQDFLLACENPLLKRSARQHLADLYRKTDRLNQAIELYQLQLQDYGDMAAQALYLMARVHLEAGQQDAARGKLITLMEDHTKSKHALKAAIEIEGPLTARAAYAVATTYHRHKRYAVASKRLSRFISSHPRDQRLADAYYLLGSAQLGNGQYDNAIKTFQKTTDQYGMPSALYRIGGIHVRRNREREAIATYENFASRFPQHALADEALWQAAKSAERNNHFAEAERLYRLLVENHPESDYRDEAGWSLGFTFYCREEYGKALVIFKRLSDMAVEPHIADQSLYWAGKAAAQLGHDVESESYYRRAAAGFPRSYYSTRAVKLGYSDPATLQKRPPLALRRTAAIDRIEGIEYLERGDALYALGLRQMARSEMLQAETRNRDQLENLKLIRDRYEALGFLDRAVRLSMRIFVQDNKRDEWYHIYPNYYWEQILTSASEAKVDPYLVLSVIRQESTFNEDATSRAGALGLMQIMPHTGKTLAHTLGIRRFERSSLYDPKVSIRLGSYFLGDQVRQFSEGPTAEMGFELGLAAYNAGPHNARQWLERFPHDDADAFVERIPFKETRLYVKLVLRNYAIYKALSDA